MIKFLVNKFLMIGHKVEWYSILILSFVIYAVICKMIMPILVNAGAIAIGIQGVLIIIFMLMTLYSFTVIIQLIYKYIINIIRKNQTIKEWARTHLIYRLLRRKVVCTDIDSTVIHTKYICFPNIQSVDEFKTKLQLFGVSIGYHKCNSMMFMFEYNDNGITIYTKDTVDGKEKPLIKFANISYDRWYRFEIYSKKESNEISYRLYLENDIKPINTKGSSVKLKNPVNPGYTLNLRGKTSKSYILTKI